MPALPPLRSTRSRRLASLAGGGVAAAAALVHVARRAAADHDRALARERALRRAGAALVAAPDRNAVLAAGLAAVPELAGPTARAAITVAHGQRIVVKGDAGSTPALRLPLRGRQPQGVLTIDAPRGLDEETRTVLETFAGELGIALESAGLAAQLARRDADAWYRSLIDNAADAITVLERDGTIRFQTPSIEDILGFRPEALAGTNLADPVHPDDREWVEAQFARIRRRPGAADGSVVVRWRHRDGSYRSVESRVANLLGDPAVRGIVVNSRDVTDRVALEEQLTRRAFHDGLTGLANRALFVDRLEHALYAGSPQEEALAVVFIDLDDFRKVNDSLGHPAGDDLLRICARRLTERLAAGDTAARLGGDEFAVLLESCPTPEAAGQMARYLLDALTEPVELHGRRMVVSASAGVAIVSRREQPPVDGLGEPEANVALVRAIVELARSFGLRTVAEGIEDRDQLAPLLRLGCDLAQGYLFARPASAADVAALAEANGVSPRLGAAAPRGATPAS